MYSFPDHRDTRNPYSTNDNHSDSYYQTPNLDRNGFEPPQAVMNTESFRNSSGNMSRMKLSNRDSDNLGDRQYLNGAGQYTSLSQNQKVKKRKYCCCFSKRGLKIFLVCLFFFLVGLGIAGFFLWPRIPDGRFKDIALSNNSPISGSSVQELLQATRIQSTGVVAIPLLILIDVDNPNYIPWTLNNVTVEGNIDVGNGVRFPVGSGYLLKPFKMPKKSSNNTMTINFQFTLNTTAPNFSAAVNVVKNSCSSGGSPMRFQYDAKIHMDAISWLNIYPPFSDTVNFNCPVSKFTSAGVDINSILSQFT
ncbi:hypothetical protein AYI68_g6713 [Smittium mucronatum]|uniref:Late embryogenesis abundant protein LEA-2 subgroup domain-containing protein n=1 Tax=Smittium mucronatum TaxID=133383 RepID=A0A1R0GQR3_9FUNG|nr:hypothetical protein AYI68_g6713 [Smittium mucronatum]